MQILVACEESQAVTKAMRSEGIDAISCDVLPCTGGHPEWHIQGDVTPLLEQEWDMVLAFPPCTHLSSSGARWFAQKQRDGRQQAAIEFFLNFTRLSMPWAIENPVGVMSSYYRKPDQIIQPWQFGHGETKATCLWLHKLHPLRPTQIVSGREARIWKMSPSTDRARKRSQTFTGIASAMAEQWGRKER